jgi:hypothetical protein
MKTAAKKAAAKPADVEEQVQGFIDKFDEKNQALIRSVRKALRKRFATAHELVYDNYQFFVIGYSPTERPTDSVLSMTADANGVSIMFPYVGAKMPDPHKLLQGVAQAVAGKWAREDGDPGSRTEAEIAEEVGGVPPGAQLSRVSRPGVSTDPEPQVLRLRVRPPQIQRRKDKTRTLRSG